MRTIGQLLLAIGTALALLIAPAAPAAAQSQQPTGPGQAIPQPPLQCPQTIACTYTEQAFPPQGYRLQSFLVCGANCTTQYWISDFAGAGQLLEIDPTRGGALIALDQSTPQAMHPDVRVVMPQYAASDPACCPSMFADTTYSYDDGAGSLTVSSENPMPANQFPGYDQMRQQLTSSGWLVVQP